MVFLAAGTDTTALTLAWLHYYLATNPDIQVGGAQICI